MDHLPPGSIIRRRMLVVNKSAEPRRVGLYPAAAALGEERFHFGTGQAANELTSWMALDHDHVDLPPRSEATVKLTIKVPPEASAGERYAVVWASLASDPDPSANVNMIHRVGIRVYLDVGPGGEPPSSFTIGDLVPARDKNGVPSVNIRVENTGDRALDLTGSVSLSEGPAGIRAGPFDVVGGTTLAPGETGTVLVAFPADLPNGPWKIDVELRSGMVRQNGSGRVVFPEAGQVGKPIPLFARLSTPWSLAGGSLGVGIVILVGLAYLARRSPGQRAVRKR